MPAKRVTQRLAPFGETVFATWSRLAVEHDAINLGQGFPDFPAPDFVKEAAIAAIRDDENQYARSAGHPSLVTAVAESWQRETGIAIDPMEEVTVTCGSTEAIAAAILGLIEPGDEVVIFEPFYDSYLACISMAGGTPRIVTLHTPDFTFDEAELAAAFSDRTAMVIVNTPHNPTGRVFTRDELQAIADLAQLHDAVVLADEVYDALVLEGEHLPIATLDGMAERTITMRSLGKVFSVTGWKIGWSIAPSDLSAGMRAAHQFMTFCAATPLQVAAATCLTAGDEYFDAYRSEYLQRRDLLVAGLLEAGLRVSPPQGTYFALADHSSLALGDDVAFCRHLVERCAVVAIPPSSFYALSDEGRGLARFAFCKDVATLSEATRRLAGLRA